VAHPLTAHLGARDLDAALVADDALVADALVLAAVALPVPAGTEDALVEQAVLLGTQRPVVDRLGLGDLALRPVTDLLGGSERDPDRVEVVDLEHGSPLPRWRDAASGAGPLARCGPCVRGAPSARRSSPGRDGGCAGRTSRGWCLASPTEHGEVECHPGPAADTPRRPPAKSGSLLVIVSGSPREARGLSPELLDEDLERLPATTRRLDVLPLTRSPRMSRTRP
jgi:hypothetical protein